MRYADIYAGRRQILAWGASSLVLAGCGSIIGPSQAPLKIYMLSAPPHPAVDLPSVAAQLTVSQPEAAHSFQSARIGLSRDNTFDYYADAQWMDSTPHLLQSLLVQAFENTGKISGVAPEAAGMHADFLLETEIRDFEARYGNGEAAPAVVVIISARLLSASGKVVGTFVGQHTSQATQNSVPAVVDAFSQATGETLNAIVAWTLTAAHESERAGRAQIGR